MPYPSIVNEVHSNQRRPYPVHSHHYSRSISALSELNAMHVLYLCGNLFQGWVNEGRNHCVQLSRKFSSDPDIAVGQYTIARTVTKITHATIGLQ